MGKVVEIGVRKKKRKKWPWVLLILLLLIAGAGVFLHSSFFRVKHPTINGNERVPDEVIMSNLDMKDDMNLIWYALKHYDTQFEMDPLILSAEVFVEWPRDIRIEVVEKKVMGYMPYMGMYLCIDTTGSVLDSVHEVEEGTPLLTGITVKSFSLGGPVDTEDTERFTIMLDILNILQKYSLTDETREISVARSEDIHLYLEDLDVSLGPADDLDRKISAVVSILEDPDRPAGILHLEDLDGQVYIEQSN